MFDKDFIATVLFIASVVFGAAAMVSFNLLIRCVFGNAAAFAVASVVTLLLSVIGFVLVVMIIKEESESRGGEK